MELEPPAASAPEPAAAVFELQTALAHVGGKLDLLKQLVTLLAQQTPTLLAAAHTAIAQHDGQALQRAAHTLKGSAGTFAAQAVVEAAQRLEDLGRQEDLTQAETAYAHLASEMARLEHALRDAL